MGVAFGESGLIRGVTFGRSGLIRGVTFDGSGLIRGVTFGGSGLIRRVTFGGSGLIKGRLLYICNRLGSYNKNNLSVFVITFINFLATVV